MKQSLSYLGIALIALITFSSCSSKADAPIPTDATFVMHINGKSLSEKLPWSEIKETQWFKYAVDNVDGDSLAVVLLNDPSQSGLDINGNGWVFLANRGKGAYSALVWDLADADKFEALIKKSAPEVKIQQKESTSYISEGSTLVAWKGKKLMLLGDASEFTQELNNMGEETEQYDSLGNVIESEEAFRFTSDSLLNIAIELQSLKSSAKLGSDDKFADLIGTKGDVHFWLNAGKMYGNTLTGSLLSLSKLGSLLEGNIAAATVSFNNGSIDIDSKGYVGKELEALYKKYQAVNFDENSLKNLPAGEVNMAMALNYPPEGLKALLTLFGVDGLVNNFMQEAGFSVDEFIKANDGNLFFALSDFNIKKVEKSFEGFDGEPITYNSTEPDGKLLFGAAVKEKNAFQKMMEVAKKLLTGKAGMSDESLSAVPYELKDKWFVSGNDSAQIKNYGAKKTDHAFIEKIKGHPLGLYVNIASFIKGSAAELGEDAVTKSIADLSLAFWKELVMTGGEFKKGASVSQVSLTLGDANTNSLKSLNQYLGKIAKIAKDEEERQRKEWETTEPVDSVTIPAPEY